MNATRRLTGLAAFMALCLVLGSASSAYAQAAAAGGQDQGAGKQPYTMAEYNSYKACADDKVPASQLKCLDDFVSKYPNSQLLIYVYPLYIQAYSSQKNALKVIESIDKYVALGDKVAALDRANALVARASTFLGLAAADQAAQAKAQRDASTAGLKVVDEVKKPEQA